jgi:hypothetical protein
MFRRCHSYKVLRDNNNNNNDDDNNNNNNNNNNDDDDDDRYAFLVSDANLRRYGISPKHLAQYMTAGGITGGGGGGGGGADNSAQVVQCFAIFLASIGDEAERIRAALPRGRGFTCFDTAALPGLFRSIFTAEFGSEEF